MRQGLDFHRRRAEAETEQESLRQRPLLSSVGAEEAKPLRAISAEEFLYSGLNKKNVNRVWGILYYISKRCRRRTELLRETMSNIPLRRPGRTTRRRPMAIG